MSDLTAAERRAFMEKANALAHILIQQCKKYDMPTVLIAAETLIAFRSTGSKMNLNDLMDNLLANIPEMYAAAIRTPPSTGDWPYPQSKRRP